MKLNTKSILAVILVTTLCACSGSGPADPGDGGGGNGGGGNTDDFDLPDGSWRFQSGALTETAMSSLVVTGPGSVIMGGGGGDALHRTPAGWTMFPAASERPMLDMWAGSETNVWGVGYEGKIARWDGTAWTRSSVDEGMDLFDVWGVDGGPVYALGRTQNSSGLYERLVLSFDGAIWSIETVPIGSPSTSLHDISGLSASNIVAVGQAGVAVHYDGTSWKEETTPTSEDLYCVWPIDLRATWAAGANGTIVSRNRLGIITSWIEIDNPISGYIKGMWGTGASNMYVFAYESAVGDYIYHWDGSAWSEVFFSETAGLNVIGGAAADEVYAAGSGGYFLQFEGTNWTVTSQRSPTEYHAAWATSTQGVYVVGDGGQVDRYDGTAWQEVEGVAGINLYGLWGINDRLFAVGDGGEIRMYDGTTWTDYPAALRTGAASTNDLYGVWGFAADDVFAVGSVGTVLRYDGMDWNEMDSGTTTNLIDVWGSSPNDVWAVGRDWIIHYDGVAWSQIKPVNMTAISGSAADDIFAVSPDGMLHFDGATWNDVDPGVGSFLEDVMYLGGNEYLAVGSGGTVLHFDGSAWSAMPSETLVSLLAIGGSPSLGFFAMGSNLTILEFESE